MISHCAFHARNSSAKRSLMGTSRVFFLPFTIRFGRTTHVDVTFSNFKLSTSLILAAVHLANEKTDRIAGLQAVQRPMKLTNYSFEESASKTTRPRLGLEIVVRQLHWPLHRLHAGKWPCQEVRRGALVAALSSAIPLRQVQRPPIRRTPRQGPKPPNQGRGRWL